MSPESFQARVGPEARDAPVHSPVGWNRLRRATLVEAGVCGLFAVVYYGADLLAHLHGIKVPLALPFEAAVPFVPGLVPVYLSLMVVFTAAKFILRDWCRYKAVAWTISWQTVIAGVFFVLVPSATSYPAPAETPAPVLGLLHDLASLIARPHNLLPSLHVAFSVTLMLTLGYGRGSLFRGALFVWGSAVVASTLLTHQHHLVDVAAGILLALVTLARIYRPYIEDAPAPVLSRTRRLERRLAGIIPG